MRKTGYHMRKTSLILAHLHVPANVFLHSCHVETSPLIYIDFYMIGTLYGEFGNPEITRNLEIPS